MSKSFFTLRQRKDVGNSFYCLKLVIKDCLVPKEGTAFCCTKRELMKAAVPIFQKRPHPLSPLTKYFENTKT